MRTIVIGAGASGLAAANALRRRGIQVRIIDGASRAGEAWYHRHPQLRLNTHRLLSALPGLAIRKATGAFPSRDSIIRYLDDTYPEPRLMPSDKRQQAELSDWMCLASDIHVTAIKTYIYSSRPKNASRKTLDELERYRKLQTNEELLAFHAKCSSHEGISAAERASAEQLIHDAFSKLDARLARSPWLVGERFTLADITWIPLHYTLERARFSLQDYSNVGNWAQAIAARTSFKRAVLDWFDGPGEAETVTIVPPGT